VVIEPAEMLDDRINLVFGQPHSKFNYILTTQNLHGMVVPIHRIRIPNIFHLLFNSGKNPNLENMDKFNKNFYSKFSNKLLIMEIRKLYKLK
jgi:hypothetical protein